MTETEKFLKTLNTGDRVEIIYGEKIKNAKVLNNYPAKSVIYLKIPHGIFSNSKQLFNYINPIFQILPSK